MSTESFVGVRAPNRDILIQSRLFFKPPFLRVVLPCGNIREYLTPSDVPMRSIRCNCNEIDYEHWFIVYTDEKHDTDGQCPTCGHGDALMVMTSVGVLPMYERALPWR